MLLICVWMAIPPVYGVQQPPWSNPGWAGITVILLLEPTEGATLAKTVLRVAGTVLGACLSALLLYALRASYSDVTDAVLLCGVLPPFCALCAYCKARCKPYAYLWIVCSLTPTIVVLFSYEAPEEQKPVFAAYRCFNIVVGALVVLATANRVGGSGLGCHGRSTGRSLPPYGAPAVLALRQRQALCFHDVARRRTHPQP